MQLCVSQACVNVLQPWAALRHGLADSIACWRPLWRILLQNPCTLCQQVTKLFV